MATYTANPPSDIRVIASAHERDSGRWSLGRRQRQVAQTPGRCCNAIGRFRDIAVIREPAKLLAENHKAVIAYNAEVAFSQLTAVPRLPPCRGGTAGQLVRLIAVQGRSVLLSR